MPQIIPSVRSSQSVRDPRRTRCLTLALLCAAGSAGIGFAANAIQRDQPPETRLALLIGIGALLFPMLVVGILRQWDDWSWRWTRTVLVLWGLTQLRHSHALVLLLGLIASLCFGQLRGSDNWSSGAVDRLRLAAAGSWVFAGMALLTQALLRLDRFGWLPYDATHRTMYLLTIAVLVWLLLDLPPRDLVSFWRRLGAAQRWRGPALVGLLAVGLAVAWSTFAAPLWLESSTGCFNSSIWGMSWTQRLALFQQFWLGRDQMSPVGPDWHFLAAEGLELLRSGLNLLAALTLFLWGFLQLWGRLFNRAPGRRLLPE
jgi:hypothetical protein